MKLTLKKIAGEFGMEAQNATGQTIRFDANEKIGGLGFGVRPMEAVAASLAACSSIDVLLILKKQKIELESFSVEILAKRTEGIPAVFESIHLTFVIKGEAPEVKVGRAVELSMTKYCSVSKILELTCKVSYSVSLNK